MAGMKGSEEESGRQDTSCVNDGSFAPHRVVSLREWLDRPGRSVKLKECLHVFRQVAEAVNAAHSQGVMMGSSARPSCFAMSSPNRVSFIESASCSSSGWSYGNEEPLPPSSLLENVTEDGSKRASDISYSHSGSLDTVNQSSVEDPVGELKKAFQLKQILSMEFNWYSSPEEAPGGHCTFASDIFRLGVLLFELFCKFTTLDEKLRTMSNLNQLVLPPELLIKWPKEASFCLWLLHPKPNDRPKMSEVLESEFLNEPRSIFEDHEVAIKLKEEIEDQELLLKFLFQLRQRKNAIANNLHDTISFLSADIEEVQNKWSALNKTGCSYMEVEKNECSTVEKCDQSLLLSVNHEVSSRYGSRKRARHEDNNKDEHYDYFAEGPRSDTSLHIQDTVLSKKSRFMKNFKRLEAAYFSTRCRLMKPSHMLMCTNSLATGPIRASIVGTEESSVDELASKENLNGGRKSEWITPFLEDLCKYMSFSKMKVRADLKPGDLLHSSNVVCSLGFDRDKEFFATAGVNKKIKVFEYDAILNEDREIHYPMVEMKNRSKLSSICWNNYIKNQIASSDFEGFVKIWDVTRSLVLMEMMEHEKRVWSLDFSLADPTKLASASDDGTVKLWNINQAVSIGTIKTEANVCCVQFSPNSSYSLAISSADHNIYCYDLRNLRMPCWTIVGHTRTVSYVKYLDSSNLVSASTDNSLKLWDVTSSTSRVLDNPLQTFVGHTNVKNFVGLSVSDGYIATGSETNEVFIYHKVFPMPVMSYKFNEDDNISGQEVDNAAQFISSVCWRGQSSTLLAANSRGHIKVLEMI